MHSWELAEESNGFQSSCLTLQRLPAVYLIELPLMLGTA